MKITYVLADDRKYITELLFNIKNLLTLDYLCVVKVFYHCEA